MAKVFACRRREGFAMLYGTYVWFGFFVLAFANGALREMGLRRFMSVPAAQRLSVLTAILLFDIFLHFTWKFLVVPDYATAIALGLYWVVLTVLAETFVVGRWLGKESWSKIFENYNVFAGKLWPLVLLYLGMAPVIYFWWHAGVN